MLTIARSRRAAESLSSPVSFENDLRRRCQELSILQPLNQLRYFGLAMSPERANQPRHQYARIARLNNAMADYVMVFGGSYGSLDAPKVPHLVQGYIVSSAPVLSFLEFDPSGSSPRCAINIVWPVLIGFGATASRRTA
ncbi:hypothetical protein H257_06200 [Aphanomyces astaci]|uniref:Uncharacterized protein n=1 Tax=Aphanomyces astaci TaxID=112090 RepID=W4GPA0_APHAT|nr:hypothetical protein H257_06200 [Aphanomyces astaci]ETV80698.1 hypothetical protein H257_06200 [Aphanomyces astaci]|eukprot:XP_009829645.1 hypothetical protein H257_06200 [Aphanomyces astaci]